MATASAPTKNKSASLPHRSRVSRVQTSTYDWAALDKRGKLMKGTMPAKNASLVKAELRRQGMNPQSVRERRKPLFSGRHKAVKSSDIAVFSRQLATMTNAGIHMVHAFNIIAESQKNARFKNMLNDIRLGIEGGQSLHESLGKYPTHFDELYRNLVRTGESAGVLDNVLETIATYKERTETMKKKIKKAMFYPIMVLVVVFAVTTIMLLYVVPVFAKSFADAGTSLPALTQFLLDASAFTTAYWLPVFVIIAGAVASLILGEKRSATLAHFLDRVALKTPVMGRIVRNSAIARLTRTLGVTFRAGVPLVEAMDTVAGATGNSVYGNAVRQMRDDVATGHPLQLAMRQTSLFPAMVVQMTAIGEESGALDSMLFKVADFYEEEVNNTVDTLSTLLEPLIIIVLGIIVGSMVIALYLPIFKLAGTF